jgi:hypothetical protein
MKMPYIIDVDKRTGKIENKGMVRENLPKYIQCSATPEKFSFQLPVGYAATQIYWNNREPSFEEYFVLLKGENRMYSKNISDMIFYSGSSKLLQRKEIIEFDESELDKIVNQNWEGNSGKIVFQATDKKIPFKIETKQIGKYKGEYPNRVSLIYKKQEIPLEELLVKGKGSL